MPLNDTTTLCKGQHLTLTERIEIQTLNRQGFSNRRIAKALNRSHSTINDEIKRGLARQACLPKFKLLKVDRFIQYANEQIKVNKRSPNIIVGRAIEQGLFDAMNVSV